MIDRNDYGRITVTCDECGTMDGGESHEWREAWPLLKMLGWRTFAEKRGKHWTHRCPKCVDDWRESLPPMPDHRPEDKPD